jgi:hypothetical protein
VCLGSGDSPHTGHLDNRHRSFVGLDLRDYETPKVGFALLRTNMPERDETPMKTGDSLGYHSAPLCADMHRGTVPTDTAIDTGIWPAFAGGVGALPSRLGQAERIAGSGKARDDGASRVALLFTREALRHD